MLMTILEAKVDPDQASLLEQTFRQGIEHLDAGIVQTFLLRGAGGSDLWRILTVWESREALDTMRASGETPRGVLMFRAADAEPALSVFEVLAQAAA